MKFLNYENDDPRSTIEEKFEAYTCYLNDNAKSFPQQAYEFAAADWHYNPQDHRCPHDAWLESLQIIEKLIAPDNKRDINIRLILLGAYHDGKIEINYECVEGYNFSLEPDSAYQTKSHGDWLIDEIRLSERNRLVHEIRFWLNGNWQIECKDISYKWLPFEK